MRDERLKQRTEKREGWQTKGRQKKDAAEVRASTPVGLCSKKRGPTLAGQGTGDRGQGTQVSWPRPWSDPTVSFPPLSV